MTAGPPQLLIATMNGRFFTRDYIPPFDYIVINQDNQSVFIEQPRQQGDNVFHYQETGLSRSRNRALQHSTADICLIADDDLRYLEGAEYIVADAFQRNPSADIITFQAQTPNRAPFKRYSIQRRWHSLRSIMRVSSLEIAFRRSSLRSVELCFDERFGLGAEFPTGEENIFLIDALHKGLKILYLPIPIVIHPEYHSGGDFHNHNLIMARGAMFCRMFARASWLVALAFAFKKYRMSDISFGHFYRLMCRGIVGFKEKN